MQIDDKQWDASMVEINRGVRDGSRIGGDYGREDEVSATRGRTCLKNSTQLSKLLGSKRKVGMRRR